MYPIIIKGVKTNNQDTLLCPFLHKDFIRPLTPKIITVIIVKKNKSIPPLDEIPKRK